MSSNAGSFDPSKLTPLFTAQVITCAYPVSDLYASSPRYLYYALLIATFATQWYPWLANVFLGAAATYAGTAAIEALILISNPAVISPAEVITIPYVAENSVVGNSTLSALTNLVTNVKTLRVQPAALELDVDGILAIVVTGYLMMLPIHCWSPVIKAHRVRHLLMGLWNLLMLAGTICTLVLWIRLFDVPYQYRFCYPDSPDADSVTSDNSSLPSGIWQGDWNSTIWNTYSNLNLAFSLPGNCLYPCFNTSQIMRRANTLTASVSGAALSPRTDVWISDRRIHKLVKLIYLMYAAIAVSGLAAVVLLIFTVPQLRRLTRVPIHHPRRLLKQNGRDVIHILWTEFKYALELLYRTFFHPRQAIKGLLSSQISEPWRALRWVIDITALLLLFLAMIFIPATIVIFIVWIEWYIHRDINSSELPSQVGQWTSSVSIALVLISAVILRLFKYRIASYEEVGREIDAVKERLLWLETLHEKMLSNEQKRRQTIDESTEMGKIELRHR